MGRPVQLPECPRQRAARQLEHLRPAEARKHARLQYVPLRHFVESRLISEFSSVFSSQFSKISQKS